MIRFSFNKILGFSLGLLCLMFISLAPSTSHATSAPANNRINEQIVGRVVHIENGQNFTIEHNNFRYKIILADISSPVRGQAHSARAKKALGDLIFGHYIKLDIQKETASGLLATAHLYDININEWMLKNGHAWLSRQSTDNNKLYKLEKQAYSSGRGLWHKNTRTATF